MKLYERAALLIVTALPCAIASSVWGGKSWSYFCGALAMGLYALGTMVVKDWRKPGPDGWVSTQWDLGDGRSSYWAYITRWLEREGPQYRAFTYQWGRSEWFSTLAEAKAWCEQQLAERDQ